MCAGGVFVPVKSSKIKAEPVSRRWLRALLTLLQASLRPPRFYALLIDERGERRRIALKCKLKWIEVAKTVARSYRTSHHMQIFLDNTTRAYLLRSAQIYAFSLKYKFTLKYGVFACNDTFVWHIYWPLF